MMISTQGCGGDPKENRQARETKYDFSTSPFHERQRKNRGLEVGSQPGPSSLQRAFCRFRMTIVNSGFPDRTCHKYPYNRFRHPHYGIRYSSHDGKRK